MTKFVFKAKPKRLLQRPKRTFRKCQKEAYDYAFKRKKIALFMEMRLGKTMVAIRWAINRTGNPKFPGRKLIIAPLTVLPGWYSELLQEGIHESDIHYIDGPTKERHLVLEENNKGFFLMNPETLQWTKKVCDYKYDCLIVDESSILRNNNDTVKVITERFNHVEYKCLLTGTPAPESPMNYFNQFKFLNGHFLGIDNWWKFRGRYFNQVGYSWEPRPKTLKTIKQELRMRAFIMTRKQAGLKEHKVAIKRYVKMNPAQFKAYKEIMKKFAYEAENGEKLRTKYVPVQHTWLQRVAGGFSPDGKELISDAKLKEIMYLLKGELKGQQVVIWARYTSELQLVHDELKKKGYTVRMMTGDTPFEKRKPMMRDFHEHKQFQVFCIQTMLGKFGLDLSAASAAIYYSNYYQLEIRKQSEDRVVHFDKKEPLLIIDLIAKDSVDEDVLDALDTKQVMSKFLMSRLKDSMFKWSKKTYKSYKESLR